MVRDGAYVHVTMGTLVDARSILPTRHIFAGSKAPLTIVIGVKLMAPVTG